MKTFYINTASKHASIAIYDGNDLIAAETWPSQQNESEMLLPSSKDLFQQSHLSPEDIDRVVVCVGPGGFTSVRVGVSAANAWSLAHNVPLATVNLFDLYKDDSCHLFICANKKEAWWKAPGQDPMFVSQSEWSFSESSFRYDGILNEEWQQFLQEHGGTPGLLQEQFPDISQLEWSQQTVQPWYYKQANITWSAKNKPR